jgi:hypothetical protein
VLNNFVFSLCHDHCIGKNSYLILMFFVYYYFQQIICKNSLFYNFGCFELLKQISHLSLLCFSSPNQYHQRQYSHRCYDNGKNRSQLHVEAMLILFIYI